MVQWLGLGAFTAVAWVQSLVGELRSYKLCSAAKKKKKEKSGGIIGNLYFPFHSTMNFLKFCDGYCKQESYKRKKTFSHV